ncbi:MAG TPA: OmpA family protein [Kineosporiaceae bacterium]
MLETVGPVAALTDALQARDVHQVVGLLAHDVQLSVPPLHYSGHGTQDVVGALAGLLGCFGELRYEIRSRYLAPGTVTDEVTLVGRQLAPFLGAEPGRELSRVPARLLFTHDAATVTGITVWPDLAALHAGVAGACRVIDLTRVGGADALVASLRASLPTSHPKLIIGSARDERGLTAADQLAPATPDPGPLAGRRVPKAPVPRAVRRRRTVLAGSAMLVVSTALSLWVATGALQLPGRGAGTAAGLRVAASGPGADPAAGTGPRSGGAGPAGAAAGRDGTRGTGAGPGGGGADPTAEGSSRLPDGMPAERTLHLSRGQRSVILSTDELFLFDVDKAQLRPGAAPRLASLVTDARQQHRRGLVTVSGYTDSHGSAAHNLELSERRAETVAAVLRGGLRGTGMTVRARGYGERDPRATNVTVAGRQANRRVVVTFPTSG